MPKKKTKDSIKLLKEEVLNLSVKIYQLKDYLVENRTIYDDDFRKFCEYPEKYKKEKIEIKSAKVYIVSLQKNKRIREYYQKNWIRGGNFIEILKSEDIQKIADGDMIYFLSSRDIPLEFKKELIKSGAPGNIKIAVCPKKFRRLTDICFTYMKASQNYKKTHRFLKEIIECIALPSLVGLDYADICQLFMMSARMELRRYKANITERDKIIEQIRKEFKKIDGCFFVASGGQDFSLDDVAFMGDNIGSLAKHIVFGARIEDHLKGKIELRLYVGFRK